MSHEEYVSSCRERAADIARGILDGTVPLLEGCHALASLHAALEVPERDSDFETFVVISSECDSLPIGAARFKWAPDALAKLEPEIQSAIAWATPLALPACRSVLQRFGA
ncbi:hypothetical protein GCM10023332_24440 [Luteimonas vadosa]|uniref:DUF2489 domain-containing protein n=1 Tax=Luteimonas vadosa TaxID=1165507 RepID=A0ABP9EA76_9GAMM